ncbi:hypothetical protein H2203_009148 [Taxawa tesnikishii (nom. ined.)]|nr:hypothetical protein H2203_009148 [Dothideales sp. JES 119]
MYRPSTPGPSPAEASARENARPTSHKTTSDPVSEQSVADLAAMKLERQNKRITESDNDLLTGLLKHKSGTRNKGSKVWRPFDFTDNSADNSSVTDTDEPHNPCSFDVHAQVFQPSRAELPRTEPPAVTIHLNTFLDSEDTEDDFQLVTGRKFKAAPLKAPIGLNAHEVKTEDKPATVTASFNKRQINEVFGNDLPTPDILASTPGTREGQVQFVIHPNGDVSAQQWSLVEFQWHNIGQYSNIRKRTEGQLAADRLKGQTELQTLQQNTLAYFRALGKQREATTMGLPFGPKEVQACLPNIRIERPSHAESQLNTSPSKAFTTTDTDSVMAEDGNAVRHDADDRFSTQDVFTSSHNPNIWAERRTVHQERRVTSGLTMPAEPSSTLPMAFTQGRADWAQTYRLVAERRTQSRPPSPSPLRKSESNNDLVPTAPTPVPGLQQRNWDPPSGPSRSLNSLPFQPSQLPVPAGTQATSAQANRSAMRDYLMNIGNAASARGQQTTAPRTVLHDPLQSKMSSDIPSDTLFRPSNQINYAPVTSSEYSWNNQSFLAAVAGSHQNLTTPDEGKNLKVSEPEGDWSNRRVDVVTFTTPYLSNEDFRPLNPHGPFFTDTCPPRVSQKSKDEELREWFYGGNRAQRQEDFYQQIKSAHYQRSSSKPASAASTPIKPRAMGGSGPGVIGPPSSASTPQKRADRAQNQEFNEATTRLLIPVLENLASYVEGPASKRYGYFAPFVQPPAWCIDTGPQGNQSFFDTEWGRPPARIGRDSRYRPLAFEGRFGGFEPGEWDTDSARDWADSGSAASSRRTVQQSGRRLAKRLSR